MNRAVALAVVVLAAGLVALTTIRADRTGGAGPIARPEADAVTSDGFDLTPAPEVVAAVRAPEMPVVVPEGSATPAGSGHGARRDRGAYDVSYSYSIRYEAGVVEARVVDDESGIPIPGAVVELEVDGEARPIPSGPLGIAEFTAVPEGVHWIRASSPGRAADRRELAVSPVAPFATIVLRLAVEREFVVKLVDAHGRPFRATDWGLERSAADRIGISLAARCGTPAHAFDRSDGLSLVARSIEAELGVPAWSARTRSRGPACVHAVLADVVLGATALDEAAVEVAIRVDTAAIARAQSQPLVRVLDARDDTPIAGASVTVGKPGTGPVLQTAADGRVRIPSAVGIVPDAVVTAEGYVRQRLESAGPATAEHVVRLQPGRVIRGRVRDARGSPLMSAWVTLSAAGPLPDVSTLRTSADGTFEFRGAPADVFAVEARSGSGRAQKRGSATADCTTGDALDLELIVRE